MIRIRSRTAAASLALALVLALTSACASTRPPPGTYTPLGQKAFDAHQLFQDVQALSETAINLNATTGPLHVADADTVLIRDFALSTGRALTAYANGTGTLGVVVVAYHALVGRLSTDAKLNDKLRFVLGVVDAGMAAVPVVP